MPEDHKNMKKVQCWIPQDTWNKIVSLGYDSPTIAVTKAFEKLLEDPLKIPEISPNDPRVNPLVSPKDPIESPDIPVYKVKIEALEMVLAEKDRSIERLENDLKKADIDKEDLKAMHNNYMLQVQSLINARALTPPGSTEGEKTKQESKPAREKKESRYREKEERLFDVDLEESPAIKESLDIEHEVKPEVKQGDKDHWKEKEATIKKTCKNCLQPFLAKNPKNEYCSPKCRTAFNRRK